MNFLKMHGSSQTSCENSNALARVKSAVFGERFAVFWRVTAALLCLGLTVALAEGPPTLPTAKKKTARLHSPRGKELFNSTPMAIALPERRFFLTWEYPLPTPRAAVEFDIESRVDVGSQWQKIGSTNQPPYQITTTAPSGFYRVGAHRTDL